MLMPWRQAERDVQASRLRRVPTRHPDPELALTIAVTSGKGGVGKSNVAVNLVASMAGRGLRATIVDADLGLANADLLLGVRSPYNLSHVLSGARTIEEVG